MKAGEMKHEAGMKHAAGMVKAHEEGGCCCCSGDSCDMQMKMKETEKTKQE
jgi:hypothetical protein